MYGFKTIVAALLGQHRNYLSLYVDKDYENSKNEDIKNVIKLAESRGLKVEYKEKVINKRK
jgi:hypothetical protein